jgi:Collagen triple helix repeat (20 copies)
MLTKRFVLVVAVLVVVLSVGGSWGVAALASSHTASAPISSASGSPGTAGTNGEDGTDGKNGATGKAGSNGTAGARGTQGATGAAGTTGPAGVRGATGSNGTAGTTGPAGSNGTPGATGTAGATGPVGATGPAGPQGPAGTSGASAPTFSAISASGVVVPAAGSAFTFSSQTAAVPAGPALVGFSVTLVSVFPSTVICSLVDANNPATVFATTAGQLLTPATPSTFATTQAVNLTASTNLTIQCTSDAPAPLFNYQDLSIYAISFAP